MPRAGVMHQLVQRCVREKLLSVAARDEAADEALKTLQQVLVRRFGDNVWLEQRELAPCIRTACPLLVDLQACQGGEVEKLLLSVGEFYRRDSKTGTAPTVLEDLLDTQRRVHSDGDAAQKKIAATLGEIGEVYSDLGRPQDALEKHEASLAMKRKFTRIVTQPRQKASPRLRFIARLLGKIGLLYSGLGRPQESGRLIHLQGTPGW
eukprot:g68505.t1